MDEDLDNLDLGNDDNLGNFDNNYFDDFGGFSGDSNMSKYSDLLKELTNFNPIIKKRMEYWLGIEWDEDNKNYVQVSDPIINEKGARWLIGVLLTYQSNTNFITNINQYETKWLYKDINQESWLIFGSISDEFGVKSNADFYKIAQELQHSAMLVLAGAGDGKYTKFFGESVHRTESLNISPHQQRPQQQQQAKMGFMEGMKNKLLGRG